MFWGAPWHIGYWNPFLWIMPIIVIGLILLGFWYLVGANGRTSIDSAVETLRKRYASGELSKEEYYRMLEDLKR